MERTPLFLALTRPARVAGLPVAYFAVWSVLSTVGYLLLISLWIVIPIGFLYLVLRALAEIEPRFFEVVMATTQATPRTSNRAYWNGDSYGA